MPHIGNPVQVPANGTVNFNASCVSGFLCTTAGNIAISKLSSNSSGEVVTTVVPTLAVSAGDWVDIPIKIGTGLGRIVASGGAVGVLVTG